MIRPAVRGDFAIGAIVALLALLLGPGLAITGMIALLILLIALYLGPIRRIRRRPRRSRGHATDLRSRHATVRRDSSNRSAPRRSSRRT